MYAFRARQERNGIAMEKLIKKINMWKKENIIILQEGFIKSKYKINEIDYKIENEVLKIMSKKDENYIEINLNQIYKIEEQNEEIKLYLDNDTEIKLVINNKR